MKLRNLAAAICLTALPCSFANASSVSDPSQMISIPTTTISGVNTAFGATFADFNTALGTLNSVTVSIAGSATFSGTGQLVESGFFLPGPGASLSGSVSGTSFFPTPGAITLNDSQTDSVAFDTALFSQPGSIAVNLELIGGGGSVTFTAPSLTETVTYNYTPTVTSPAPEPSSITLLTTGLGSLGFFRRRIIGKFTQA